MGCNTPDYRYEEQPVNITGGTVDEVANVTSVDTVDTLTSITNNVTVDIDGVFPTAFNELANAELTPNIQLQFPYIINQDLLHIHQNNLGTASNANGKLTVSSGAATSSYAEVQSRAVSKYRTGQGALYRGAGFFSTGVTGNEQLIGIGTVEDGFFFGYNGASFGILHRRGGAKEIRTLTVTTKSSTAENITITLNSVADATVAVTNGTNATTTAGEIAAHDYSNVGDGWDAYQAGASVIFVARKVGSKAGTYSLSGATTAIGTFAQSRAGAAATNNWIPQATWNVDTFDGNGPSGVTLIPTYGNVYQIQYQWLGYGMIKFFIENGNTGNMVNVHNIKYANTATVPSVLNPSLPVYVGSINTTNNTNISVNVSSIMAGTQGKKVQLGTSHGASNIKTPGTATETPILSIRNKIVFGGVINRTAVKLSFMSCSVSHNKPCSINFWGNTRITGATWTDVHTNSSCMEKSTTGTAISGGDLLFSLSLGQTGNQTVTLPPEGLAGTMYPGDNIVATLVPESGTTAIGSVSFNWTEDF